MDLWMHVDIWWRPSPFQQQSHYILVTLILIASYPPILGWWVHIVMDSSYRRGHLSIMDLWKHYMEQFPSDRIVRALSALFQNMPEIYTQESHPSKVHLLLLCIYLHKNFLTYMHQLLLFLANWWISSWRNYFVQNTNLVLPKIT